MAAVREAPGGTIVVANDDPAILELIAQVLEDEGYRAVTCRDAEDALRRVAEARPILVIADVRMPPSPDWLVLDRLRADRATAGLPLLVCSAGRREPEETERLGQGVAALPMPFELDDLLEEVRQLTA
jgi:CheY-like chemotaxis protein